MPSDDVMKQATLKGIAGRDAYGLTLAQLGKENENIVVMAADALESTKGIYFAKEFPERTFNFGIAEANMVGAAAGMAVRGKVPVVAFYGFLTMRVCEQVRTDICYPRLNVKIAATASGLAMGAGGSTHHGLEDIAIMRSFPNMTVVCPASPIETVKATQAVIAEHDGPVYLRLVRGADFGGTEELYDREDIPFEIGKAITLNEGEDVSIVATGQVVGLALQAGKALEREGISARVINMHTVKPIDVEAIKRAARETAGIITVEEHSTIGGLGDAVCSVVCEECIPTRVRKIGIRDQFCSVGPTSELWSKYGLSKENIIDVAKSIVQD